jgi:hypothetical protein
MSLLVPDRSLLDLDGNPIDRAPYQKAHAQAAYRRGADRERHALMARLHDDGNNAFISGQFLRLFERGELPDAQPDDLPLFRGDVIRFGHPCLPDFWDAYLNMCDVARHNMAFLFPPLRPSMRASLLGQSSHAALALAVAS